MTAVVDVLAFSLGWDPQIRAILAVGVGVVVLCGSVYLLLGTNLGARLGFLVAAAGLTGWMAVMGIMWWVYGIGLVGQTPSWEVVELVANEDPTDLSAAATEEVRDVGDLEELPPGDPARGEAQAAADEALTAGPLAVFEDTGAYLPIDAYEIGGKDPDSFWSRFPFPHPAHYAVIQVQAELDQGDVPLGEAPPPAEADPDAPVYSVVLVRDLGSLRVPPAVFTLSNLAAFAVLASVLHRRDKEAARVRAAAARA